MDEKKTKGILKIITFTALLVAALFNLRGISSFFAAVYEICKPIVIGFFLAYALNIPVAFFERLLGKKIIKEKHRMRRMVSIGVAYVLTAAVLAVLIFLLIPKVIQSLNTLIQKLPDYAAVIYDFLIGLFTRFNISDKLIASVSDNWEEYIVIFTEWASDSAVSLINFAANIAESFFNIFIGVVFSVYLISSKEKIVSIIDKICSAFIKPNPRKVIYRIIGKANATFGRYIGGQITDALILGVLCFVGMLILGLPYAALISVIIGITGLIPVVGSYFGIVPSALIILLENPAQALVFTIFILILQQIENNVIYPKVVGNALGIDGLFVFLGVTIGGGIWGVLGMLIGVPLMAVLYSVLSELTNNKLTNKEQPTQKELHNQLESTKDKDTLL